MESILVFDPNADTAEPIVAAVKQLKLRAVSATTTDEALALLQKEAPAAALVGQGETAVEFGAKLREHEEHRVPLALVVNADESEPEKSVSAAEADGFLRRPVTVSALETFLSLSGGLLAARRRVEDLEMALAQASKQQQGAVESFTRMGFHHFEAIKDLLVVEVRRAKRYGYPLAVLMVGLDPLPEDHALAKSELKRQITSGIASAIAKSVRMIDLPVQYAEDRIMIFLPHTDLDGAEEVGRRIKRRIKRITYHGDKVTAHLTASVGVAGMAGGDYDLSFAKLIKSASSALKAAQLKGGDKVMKRVPAEAASTPRS